MTEIQAEGAVLPAELIVQVGSLKQEGNIEKGWLRGSGPGQQPAQGLESRSSVWNRWTYWPSHIEENERGPMRRPSPKVSPRTAMDLRRLAAMFVVGLALSTAACASSGLLQPAKTTPSIKTLCGTAPPNAKRQQLRSATRDSVELFVATKGSPASERNAKKAMAREFLSCRLLTYRACSLAIRKGATTRIAQRVRDMSLAAPVCSRPTVAKKPYRKPYVPPKKYTPPPSRNNKTPTLGWSPGKYMQQALERTKAEAVRLQRQRKFFFDRSGSAVLGAFLKKGTWVGISRRLVAGVDYAIVGGGSNSVQNLNIQVLDTAGKVVASDVTYANTTLVRFRARTSGKYRIRLQLAATRVSGSFATIALMSTKGFNVPVGNLGLSLGGALKAVERLDRESRKRGLGGFVFHATGDWCLYAIVLKPGAGVTFRGLDLGVGHYKVLGSTDGQSRSLGLQVIDRSNKVVGQAAGRAPVVTIRPRAPGSYGFSISLPKHGKPSLATALVVANTSNRPPRVKKPGVVASAKR